VKLTCLAERLGLNADSRAFRLLFGYLKTYRRLILGAAALLSAPTCLRLVTPSLTGYVIDWILSRKAVRTI
jgi:ABC-type multidrug transport system fused ATPase/permease subunit